MAENKRTDNKHTFETERRGLINRNENENLD